MVDLPNSNPDIILLNETSTKTNFDIKLFGYTVIQSTEGPASGVAILIKNNIKFHLIPTLDPSVLAVKILTTIGPVTICTAYSPYRIPYLPTIDLYKIFNCNHPALIMADLNSHNSFMHNTLPGKPKGDPKGSQLVTLAKIKKLNFLGPYFKTFKTHRAKSTPDVVLANQSFDIFHTRIIEGNPVGSDHIPVILKCSLQPIKSLVPSRIILSSLNIINYKSELSSINIPSLDGCPVSEIDDVVSQTHSHIQKATKNNCQTSCIKRIQNYDYTPSIKIKLLNFQKSYLSYYITGFPTIISLNSLKWELVDEVRKHQSSQWKRLVDIASENRGDPTSFWKKINRLRGNNKTKSYILRNNYINDDSEDSDFGEEISESITDPHQQAVFMSNSWKTVFKPNDGAEFRCSNVRKVEAWISNNQNIFKINQIINFNSLIPDHPLMRPVTLQELFDVLKTTKNKTPGLSGIKIFQIKNLPHNFFLLFIDLFNAILASHYMPSAFKTAKLIFIPKPGKDASDPLNYRPISLLEVIGKLFEKILSRRILYYFEYHNLLSPNQFGYRPLKSTQQAIYYITETITENTLQHRTSLLATRDVEKAFDSLWQSGLLYKLSNLYNLDLSFIKFIANYLSNRTLIPFFQGTQGISFSPKAGVPQGSCLGPILYIIFNNDLPLPLFRDTIISKFADDIIHVIRSDNTNKKNRAKNAKSKLEQELTRTLKWERNWKIKTNLSKCQVAVAGSTQKTIEKLGGISVNGEDLPITSFNKILGFAFNSRSKATNHVTSIVAKAKYNINKLYRFIGAPLKVKKYLYTALIRPLLEYPCFQLSCTGKTNMRKLQVIQNKALRFICNVKLSDRKKSSDLHAIAKLDPINIRLASLTKKFLYKLKALFHSPDLDEDERPFLYFKLISDFQITEEPYFPPKNSLGERVVSRIFKSIRNRKLSVLNLPLEEDDYPLPLPIFR